MIFSDGDIKRALKLGDIRIEPFVEESLQPASVDLRLGNVFWMFKTNFRTPTILDPLNPVAEQMERFAGVKEIVIPVQGFVLGAVIEKVSLSNRVVARIEGKSSLARMGISVHSTGGFIDPGNQDLNITLEIANHSPLLVKLYVGMWIAQLAFQYTLTPCEKAYGPARGSRYYADSEPVPSRVSENVGPEKSEKDFSLGELHAEEPEEFWPEEPYKGLQ